MSRICRFTRTLLIPALPQIQVARTGGQLKLRGLCTLNGQLNVRPRVRKTLRVPGDSLRTLHVSTVLQGTTSVRMPSLSPTMEEGTIVQWLKKEGDAIAPGDVLCEIQTDKAVVSLEFDDEGVLAKILKPADSGTIRVGSLIALVVEEVEDWQNVELPAEDSPPPKPKPSPAPSSVQASAPPPVSSGPPATEILLGPAVRNLLAHYGLDLSQVQTSGSRNVTKGDVLRAVQQQSLQPVLSKGETAGGSKGPVTKTTTSAPFRDLEITNMRRTIAKRLLESKATIPHAYVTADSNIDKLINLRRKMLGAGLRVSLNDFIIKSVANALVKSPAINVVLQGTEVVQKSQVDISVAVATDSGLITPIVTDVAERDILHISDQVKELADKAKKGKLQPHEFMGGTFTISNLGMFGIHHFTAIINPPQCAILAVGGGHTYLDADGREEMRLETTLSYDARSITEVNASKFLAHLKHELENPTETSMGVFHIPTRLEIRNLSSG